MKRVLALSLLVFTCAALMTAHAQPVVIYNPSQSVPSGFYLRSGKPPGQGDFVTVAAFEVAPEYAALRDYADRSDRFLKRVAATEGQLVCAEDEMISIDGVQVATRIERDLGGRPLPTWSGCRRLAVGELFLLGDTVDSFDGRYWGPVTRNLIEGVWTPI
ncbi:MAG: S26 family signal peptidase [Hyphomonadaceae bacterium]